MVFEVVDVEGIVGRFGIMEAMAILFGCRHRKLGKTTMGTIGVG